MIKCCWFPSFTYFLFSSLLLSLPFTPYLTFLTSLVFLLHFLRYTSLLVCLFVLLFLSVIHPSVHLSIILSPSTPLLFSSFSISHTFPTTTSSLPSRLLIRQTVSLKTSLPACLPCLHHPHTPPLPPSLTTTTSPDVRLNHHLLALIIHHHHLRTPSKSLP